MYFMLNRPCDYKLLIINHFTVFTVRRDLSILVTLIECYIAVPSMHAYALLLLA